MIAHEPGLFAEILVWILSIATLAIVGHFTYRAFALPEIDKHPDISRKPFWYKLSYHKFYVDEVYDKIFVKPVLYMSDGLYKWIDRFFVDGIVNGAGQLALFLSSIFKGIQTGNIGYYVIVMVAGIALTIFMVVFKYFSI
jgi:NADH-quinone oxidoreductase subunit L